MRQLLFAVSIAQEPVIAIAVEPTGENVEEESPDELRSRESHDLVLIVVSVIAPVELNLPVLDICDPMIGNRDPVRVAGDVLHHLLRSGERRLGVDDPFQAAHRIEMLAENLWISKGLEMLEHRARRKNGSPSTHPLRGSELRALRSWPCQQDEAAPYVFTSLRGP